MIIDSKGRHLFLDLDGVFADFDKAAIAIFGCTGEEFEDQHGRKAMWDGLYNSGEFFENLPLMDGAKEFYELIKHLPHTFLSGYSKGTEEWAPPQKHKWIDNHFPDSKLITCWSRNKSLFMKRPNDILIDDFVKWRDLWETRGGHFIHHTDFKKTTDELFEQFHQ